MIQPFIEKAQALDLDLGFLTKNQKAGSAASVNSIANNIIEILLFVAGALSIIYLIYSGIIYITSAGNADAAKKGQQGVLYGAIGLVVIVISYYLAKNIAYYVANTIVK